MTENMNNNLSGNSMLKKVITAIAPLLICLLAGHNSYAASVDDALTASDKKTARAKASQQRIDKLSDKTSDLFQEFKQVNKQVEGLQVYNAQLEAQVAHQRQTMQDLEASIENAAVLERQIMPLTLKMIDSLGQFINLDLPFLLEERYQRVARLRDNLNRADLSAAEKFRQVLEAYKIETEYGTRIDSYTEMVDVDGQDREVNILRVGRVALIYQTTDQKKTAVWDQRAHQWQPLADSDYRRAVAKGIRMARKQAAVDMLMLPVAAPEAVQ
jgi:septal ring factor EnvC (AmiA/AmiB activator)